MHVSPESYSYALDGGDTKMLVPEGTLLPVTKPFCLEAYYPVSSRTHYFELFGQGKLLISVSLEKVSQPLFTHGTMFIDVHGGIEFKFYDRHGKTCSLMMSPDELNHARAQPDQTAIKMRGGYEYRPRSRRPVYFHE